MKSTGQGNLFVGLSFSLAGILHAGPSSLCPARSYGQLRERQVGVSLPNDRKRSQPRAVHADAPTRGNCRW